MKRPTEKQVFLVLALAVLGGVQTSRAEEHPKIDTNHGWKSLFNGRDLTGWRAIPNKNSWTVEDGTLARKGGGNLWCVTTCQKGGGDLWTVNQYGDFSLDLEFKISPHCNSGVLFRIPKLNPNDLLWWQNGVLEMQILDSCDVAKPDFHDAGALYDMLPPSKNAIRKPGQWNRATITAVGSKIVFVMNGQRVIDTDLGLWTEAHKNPNGTSNKFAMPIKDCPRRGCIFLQDHGFPVWYRNIYIKVFDAAPLRAGTDSR
jgi:hypothetical protein